MPAAKINWYYSVLCVFAKWKQVLQNTCSKVPAGTQIPEQTCQRRISRGQDLAVKTSIRNANKRHAAKHHTDVSQVTVRIACVSKIQLKLSESERKILTVPALHLPSVSFILAKIKFIESYSVHQKYGSNI